MFTYYKTYKELKLINANGYEYVDLSLPSGTLWATMNVGASKSSDYGLYFQYGDSRGYTADQVGIGEGLKKFSSDWSDYKWYLKQRSSAPEPNSSAPEPNFSKYANLGEALELEDDAAHANMGGNWHMPTPDLIKELTANTTSTWTKQDGVNGRLFTSKKDGTKSIFIPAAGYACDGSVHSGGYDGGVWSSMLLADDVSSGQYLYFLHSGNFGLSDSSRYRGFSVRGVIG